MPSPPSELFAAKSFVVEVRGAEGERREVTSTFDVSRLPGAELVASGMWETPEARVISGCVSGPGDRFVDGIEEVLFEKATWLSMRTLEREAAALVPAPAAPADVPNIRQRLLVGATTEKRPLRVQHLLAFHGDDSDLLLCSIACEGACDDVALVLEGTAGTTPAPSWLMRTGLEAAEHPTPTFGVLSAITFAVASVIVWRRPARP